MHTTVFALTTATTDLAGHTIARVIAHFEFHNEGRQAAFMAAGSIPNANVVGPVGSESYFIGREYRTAQAECAKYHKNEAMSASQAEAIAEADAHTSNAGLPSYSELLEALLDQKAAAEERLKKGRDNADEEIVRNVGRLLARIPA